MYKRHDKLEACSSVEQWKRVLNTNLVYRCLKPVSCAGGVFEEGSLVIFRVDSYVCNTLRVTDFTAYSNRMAADRHMDLNSSSLPEDITDTVTLSPIKFTNCFAPEQDLNAALQACFDKKTARNNRACQVGGIMLLLMLICCIVTIVSPLKFMGTIAFYLLGLLATYGLVVYIVFSRADRKQLKELIMKFGLVAQSSKCGANQ